MNSDLKPIAIREVRFRRADGREERIRTTLNAPAVDVQDCSCSFAIAGFGRHVDGGCSVSTQCRQKTRNVRTS